MSIGNRGKEQEIHYCSEFDLRSGLDEIKQFFRASEERREK